ncbi:MAG: hypothetical protein JNK56_21960 [Myxococcales bacterium]|nr:hypothetical protein [Myxococcales bacterium]
MPASSKHAASHANVCSSRTYSASWQTWANEQHDAELAAIGVAERGPIAAPTLVLTVGFGIGGALVLPGDA